MAGYTKLSSSLVTSTVWRESSTTRCVWITMLALADQHGEVQASVPGLADMARVTIEECEEALQVFLSPDKHSRTQDHEGRRIEPIDGGWVLLTYEKHRDLFSLEHRRALGRERARRFREKAVVTESNAPVTTINDKQKQRADTEVKEAEAEAPTPAASLAEHFTDDAHRAAYLAYRQRHRMPDGLDATIRAAVTPLAGGKALPWPTVGAALVEMRAAQVDFSGRALAGFARKVGVPVASALKAEAGVRSAGTVEAAPFAPAWCAECGDGVLEAVAGSKRGVRVHATGCGLVGA